VIKDTRIWAPSIMVCLNYWGEKRKFIPGIWYT